MNKSNKIYDCCFTVYTLSGIHILETVAKPMLQMLEIQRESSNKRIQILQTKLNNLSLGSYDEYLCDGEYKTDNVQDTVAENNACSNEVPSSLLLPTAIDQLAERKRGKKSAMLSSPV